MTTTDTDTDDVREPSAQPSFVKLAMRNMVRKGRQPAPFRPHRRGPYRFPGADRLARPPQPSPVKPADGGPAMDLAVTIDGPLPTGLTPAAGPLLRAEDAPKAWSAHLTRWLNDLQSELPGDLRSPTYSLGLRLTGDTAIAELNQLWRRQPGPTDVLAFAALEEPPPGDGDHDQPLELGDIVISFETAARQADELGETLERELLFLASHGLLHLLGWDHPDEPSLQSMLDRQERLLRPT